MAASVSRAASSRRTWTSSSTSTIRRPPRRRARHRPLGHGAQQRAGAVVRGVQREPGERTRVARRPFLEQQVLPKPAGATIPTSRCGSGPTSAATRRDLGTPVRAGGRRSGRASNRRTDRRRRLLPSWVGPSSRAGGRARAQTGSLGAVFSGVCTPPALLHAEWLGSLASRRRCTCGGDHVALERFIARPVQPQRQCEGAGRCRQPVRTARAVRRFALDVHGQRTVQVEPRPCRSPDERARAASSPQAVSSQKPSAGGGASGAKRSPYRWSLDSGRPSTSVSRRASNVSGRWIGVAADVRGRRAGHVVHAAQTRPGVHQPTAARERPQPLGSSCTAARPRASPPASPAPAGPARRARAAARAGRAPRDRWLLLSESHHLAEERGGVHVLDRDRRRGAEARDARTGVHRPAQLAERDDAEPVVGPLEVLSGRSPTASRRPPRCTVRVGAAIGVRPRGSVHPWWPRPEQRERAAPGAGGAGADGREDVAPGVAQPQRVVTAAGIGHGQHERFVREIEPRGAPQRVRRVATMDERVQRRAHRPRIRRRHGGRQRHRPASRHERIRAHERRLGNRPRIPDRRVRGHVFHRR